MNRYAILALALLAACSDSNGPGRRGDPYTVFVTHAQFTDTLLQHYDLAVVIDEAGPTLPLRANQGGYDSVAFVGGVTLCTSIGVDSLGARTIWGELRSSDPSPAGDTLSSVVFDPANIPSADSANGYGQSSDKPYFWHWYVSNDSNVVRGDTTQFIHPTTGQPCRF